MSAKCKVQSAKLQLKVQSSIRQLADKIQNFSTTYHLPPTTYQMGFTLIEILVTVAILGLISTAAISIFNSMTAAYNKSRIINELREEGTRVMGDMERLVRASEDANCTTIDANFSILNLTLDERSLEYSQNGNCKGVQIQELEAAQKNKHLYKSLSICDQTAVGEGELTNTDTTSGVNVTKFKCNISGTGSEPRVVKIQLTLEQGLAAAARQDYQASVNLETTVSTRSY